MTYCGLCSGRTQMFTLGLSWHQRTKVRPLQPLRGEAETVWFEIAPHQCPLPEHGWAQFSGKLLWVLRLITSGEPSGLRAIIYVVDNKEKETKRGTSIIKEETPKRVS